MAKTAQDKINAWTEAKYDAMAKNEDDSHLPTGMWECACGRVCERWRGQGDVSCDCGREYNAFGQLLAHNWRSMPENQSMNDSSIEFDAPAHDFGS